MLPGNYNTTVVQPVSAQSANQIGQEKKVEEEEEERDKKRVENKAKLIHTEKNKTRGAEEWSHTLHASRSSGGGRGRTGRGGASQFSQRRRRDGRGCAYRAER